MIMWEWRLCERRTFESEAATRPEKRRLKSEKVDDDSYEDSINDDGQCPAGRDDDEEEKLEDEAECDHSDSSEIEDLVRAPEPEDDAYFFADDEIVSGEKDLETRGATAIEAPAVIMWSGLKLFAVATSFDWLQDKRHYKDQKLYRIRKSEKSQH